MGKGSIPAPFKREFNQGKHSVKKTQKKLRKKIEPGFYGWKTKKIRANPDQPRKYFDPETMAGLRKSISLVGILNPPFVSMPDENDVVDLIDGERRVRAALELKMEEIPVFVGEADSDDAFIVSVASNFCREEMSEIEEAMAIERLQKDYGLSIEYIADLMGKSTAWVYNRLKYLKLHPDLAIELQQGGLSPKSALAVTSYPQESQKKIVKQLKKQEEDQILTPQQTTRQVVKISEELGVKPVKTKRGKEPLDYTTRLVLDITATSSKLSNLIVELLAEVTDKQLEKVKGDKLSNLDFELKQVAEKVKQAKNKTGKAY